MIFFKTEEELELMRISAMLVSDTMAEIAKVLKPGITTLSLDELADTYIRDHMAVPAFYNFEGYPFNICTSLNNVIAQGRPSARILREGDVVSIEAGVLKNEFYADLSYTFVLAETSPEILRLLKISKESLFAGIEMAVSGNYLGEISSAIQHYNEKQGFGVPRDLGGHGIGRALHELPQVANFGRKASGIEMRQNLVLAIEPVVNLGKQDTVEDKDGSFRTADGSVSVHFEHNVVIRPEKAWVLSDFAPIEAAETANQYLDSSYYE